MLTVQMNLSYILYNAQSLLPIAKMLQMCGIFQVSFFCGARIRNFQMHIGL
jgi:hypothetical protein